MKTSKVRWDKALIAKFNGQRILVVGDLMLDRYVYGRVNRISPEAPVPVVRVIKEKNMPGGAANVARNVQALGGQAMLCGVVGRDPNVDRIIITVEQIEEIPQVEESMEPVEESMTPAEGPHVLPE